jgi:glycerol uptake operon antiterminator
MIDFPPELELRLTRNPVIASVFGAHSIPGFVTSECKICILAHLELHELDGALKVLDRAGKFTFVNMDACAGLGQDKGALEYLKKIGTRGVVSTRTAMIQRANSMGMVTMQKVFVTDRSNLPRSTAAIEQSKPHLVQLMPWPVVSHLSAGELKGLSPLVAAGFVATAADVAKALKEGAKGISTSAAELWDLAVR